MAHPRLVSWHPLMKSIITPPPRGTRIIDPSHPYPMIWAFAVAAAVSYEDAGI
jgi:hypothetical protein